MDAELLPPMKQTLWGRLAVANFFLGGAGAGAYLVAVSLSGFAAAPLVRVASTLGPLLVLGGFVAVAAEAGRSLRGPRVLRMARDSWMSRELWAGGAFIGFLALDHVWPWIGWRIAAALAALSFALAQGWILRHCRGVSAWNVPVLPPVFFTSALASGAGMLGLVLPLAPPAAQDHGLPLGTAGLIVLSGIAWTSFITWPGDGGFRRATATLREDRAIFGMFVIGHLVPLAMLFLGLWAPAYVVPAGMMAGVGILIGQLLAKERLIQRAGMLRPITIGDLGTRPSPPPTSPQWEEEKREGALSGGRGRGEGEKVG